MKVVSGIARGKNLITLEGDSTRPTLQRVKEGIFSSIQFNVPGAKVLDLFAGSGQMGIEALSRNASFAVFVDENKEASDIITKNLKSCSLEEKSKVLKTRAGDFLSTTNEKFDIIFLDPPFEKGILDEIFLKVFNLLSENGIIIAESEKNWLLKDEIKGLTLIKEYKYSNLKVSKFVRDREE